MGPRASPGPLLGLQSKVTNFMIQGSMVHTTWREPEREPGPYSHTRLS